MELSELWLNNTNATDAVLEHLSDSAGIASLKSALPKCNIGDRWYSY